jgi:hypothetical protein
VDVWNDHFDVEGGLNEGLMILQAIPKLMVEKLLFRSSILLKFDDC